MQSITWDKYFGLLMKPPLRSVHAYGTRNVNSTAVPFYKYLKLDKNCNKCILVLQTTAWSYDKYSQLLFSIQKVSFVQYSYSLNLVEYTFEVLENVIINPEIVLVFTGKNNFILQPETKYSDCI